MEKELYELTEPQKSILLTEEYYKGTSINTICGYVFIKDAVNMDVLKKAINEVVKTNDGMRIKVKKENGECLQYISDYSEFGIDTINLKDKEELEKETLKQANIAFTFENQPLYRFVNFRLPDKTGGFIISVHHIIGDSWALGLIVKQIAKVYASFLEGNYEIEEKPSYLKYTEAEKKYKNSEKRIKDKEYWEKVFDTVPETASIVPAKNEKQKNVSCEGERKRFTFSEEQLKKIKSFCDKQNISIYNFFMAVYSVYIAKISGLDDFVIGTPILNRTNFEQKNTIGMFVSSAPLRIILNNTNTFTEFASKITTETMEAFRHQKYGYNSILEGLRKKDNSIPSLYNIILSYQVTRTVEKDSKVSYSTDWAFNGNCPEELQIHLFDLNDEASMSVAYDYKKELFNENDILDFHNRILTIINQVIDTEDILLNKIEIVTKEEKNKILNEFNNTDIDYPRNKTIVDLFEEQVEKNGDKQAAIFENEKITYRELNEKANGLARYLENLNIPENSTIGILLKRSIDVYVCMLGILKSNNNYLLIDYNLPEDRIEYMLENSNCTTLIKSSSVDKEVIRDNTIIIDKTEIKSCKENLKKEIKTSDIACIIYTSGSTGTPKGVMLTHRGIVNMLTSYKNILHIDELSNFLSMSTVSFDMFAVETYISLLSGGKVILTSEEEQKNPQKLQELILNNKVEFVLTTPSKIELLMMDEKKNCLENVKTIQLGGEIFNASLYKKIRKFTDADIYNGYGPTEITACCSSKKVENEDISIGTPFCNTKIYICNKDLNLLPIGIVGELCVAGEGISLGYINNEELTKKAFVKSDFSDRMLYKTGDLAYFEKNGELRYVKRRDNQVKLRGLRIELDEISSCIKKINGIKNAYVTIKEVNGNKSICAYITMNNSNNLEEKDIKQYIKQYLPDYMVPSFIVFLEEMPLTINGKIDARKLPDIQINKNEITHASTETEIKLESICKKYLTINNIDINTSLFEIGGDSLFAIKIVSEIYSKFGVNISVKDIFEKPSIKELAEYIENLSKESTTSEIRKVEKRKYYPLSSAQKRIYYASSMDASSTLYNTAGGIIIDQILDIEKLQECFQKLVNRHEVLRTHFNIEEDEVVQIIEDKIDFKIEIEEQGNQNLNDIYEEFAKPFDLSKAPLFRVKVVNLRNEKMLLLLDMHHIISDGASLSIVLKELCDLYNGNKLAEKQVDYKDFTMWEKEETKKEKYKQMEEFWVNQYKDEIPLLNIPTSFKRPSVQSFEGANFYTKLTSNDLNKIKEVTKKLKITPYMLMLSVYYILLSKYSLQDDIVVGTPIIGRETPEVSNMLGMFVNTLALRSKIDADLSFDEFANQIKKNCLAAFKNQAYPFDELVKKLNIKRDVSRNPIFDILFVYQNDGYPKLNINNANIEYFTPNNKTAKFDLSLEIIPIGNEISMRFEYCKKLFNEEFIQRLSSHYINILNNVLENSEVKIADIDMISKEEKNQILYEFNNTKVDYPRDKTIIELFEKQVKETPNNTAVIFEEQKLTYKELNEKSNQLARFLLDNNVNIGDIVCILLDKSLEMIVSVLAILKVGGTFLPIDINYPKERIDYIINDSKAKILLTTQNLINKANDTVQVLNVELDNTKYLQYSNENVNVGYNSDNLAYVMYTSGSTGNPKGVMVTHKNVLRLVKNNKFITFSKNERILQTGSIVFDACTFEIWGALLNGFELYIIKKELLLDATYLNEYMKKNKITSLFITTQLFNQLVDSNVEIFSTVSNVLTGGEEVSVKHMNKLNLNNKDINIIHCYGPTENTTFSTCYDVKKEKYKETVPIGKPISNSTAYVVSPSGLLNPVGVPGELWVGGDGVAKGYLNNETLSYEKFIKNPFGDGIVYKTGDLVKWLPDGNIEFIGRIDNQVKVRGFRIELNEIDLKILDYPKIKYSTTILNTINNEKVICSYFVAEEEIDLSKLKEFLKTSLPSYMIPTYMLQLEEFKMNINGKIDKKLLPTDFRSLKRTKIIKKPANEVEEKLLEIYKTATKIEEIGVTEDLFDDLRGDSLIAMKIQVEAMSQGINIPYSDIFKYSTIRLLANNLMDEENKKKNAKKDDDFDFSKYDSILKNNSLDYPIEVIETEVKDILLTGFTGFLGAHILDSFIKKEKGTVYCLIRSKNNMAAEERLFNTLHFYFDNKYDKFVGNRIKLVEGDISEEKFGLSDKEYGRLGKSISTIIHSAALVKHYGMYKEFEEANIVGTQNIVEFAKKFDLRLLHISTLSVSGNNFADGSHIEEDFETDVYYSEKNFYIGQNVEGLYARSKFEAEHIVLDAIYTSKLKATILRMGNLTSRFSEGKFQQNHFENAFVNRFKSFLQIGYAPDYLLTGYCEFTPIDICGDAIIEVARHFNPKYTVLHLMNEKRLYLDRLFDMMHKLNIKLDIVPEEKFIQIIDELLADDNKKMYIEGIINDFDKENKHLIYESKVKVECDFSKEYLSKLGVNWPEIDINYLRNYFKYLEDIGYLNIKIK